MSSACAYHWFVVHRVPSVYCTYVLHLYCQAGLKAPLLQFTPAQLAPIRQVKLAMQAAAATAPRNDHCETCKVGTAMNQS